MWGLKELSEHPHSALCRQELVSRFVIDQACAEHMFNGLRLYPAGTCLNFFGERVWEFVSEAYSPAKAWPVINLKKSEVVLARPLSSGWAGWFCVSSVVFGVWDVTC